MDAAVELGRNPVVSTRLSLRIMKIDKADAGLPKPSRETKFSGANEDRKMFIFPVQLTTRRIGNLTWLIPTLAMCDDHTYIIW